MGRESKTRKLRELGREAPLLGGVLGQALPLGIGSVGVGGYRRMERFHGLFRVSSWSLSETGDIYIWGWNEAGQLALPIKSPAEDETAVRGEGKVSL